MKLVDVPNLEVMESPSSWLMRVALRQVVDPKELVLHFGVPRVADYEIELARLSFQAIAGDHTDAKGAFEPVDLLLVRLQKLDPFGERFLLRHKSVAYHRFCPACLATDRTKYFRIEWRFTCWRWCPSHSCLLLDVCPHCGSHAALPRNMLHAGADRSGIATLDRCLHCAKPLTTGWQDHIDTLDQEFTTPWEQMLLNNGRAAVAALAIGKLQIQGDDQVYGLNRLKLLEQQGFLPHAAQFRLTHAEMLRRRLRQTSASRSSSEPK